MGMLALSRDFESPDPIRDYAKPTGPITIDPQCSIWRECSLFVAPQSPVMRNLAPRACPLYGGPIGDPVLRAHGRTMATTRYGMVLGCGTVIDTTHSSWEGIVHPKTTGFTLFAAAVILSGISAGDDSLLRLTGAGGDLIQVRATPFVFSYGVQVNFGGPANIAFPIGTPYFSNASRGHLVIGVGRTFSPTSHQVDAWSPADQLSGNSTSTTNIAGILDDTTGVTIGYSSVAANRSGVLYAGYWNRALSDREVAQLLYRPASLLRRA